MSRQSSASLGARVMGPTDGPVMVTLLWVMNMKPWAVSSCHVTKQRLGLWECSAEVLCQDRQQAPRPLNSWGTAARAWLNRNKRSTQDTEGDSGGWHGDCTMMRWNLGTRKLQLDRGGVQARAVRPLIAL
ncbi:hypothetical protein SRHO_G00307410 [Serrasalmus rhombeus]